MTLTYRPWEPQEGMAGWFRHLSAAWGDPNTSSVWPPKVLARVCQRGEPLPLVYDHECRSVVMYVRAHA